MRAPRPFCFTFQVLAANHEHARSASQAAPPSSCAPSNSRCAGVSFTSARSPSRRRRQQVLPRCLPAAVPQHRRPKAAHRGFVTVRSKESSCGPGSTYLAAHRRCASPTTGIHQAPVRNHRPPSCRSTPRKAITYARLDGSGVGSTGVASCASRRAAPHRNRITRGSPTKYSLSSQRQPESPRERASLTMNATRSVAYRVDRYIRATGFPYCQQGSDQRRRPFHCRRLPARQHRHRDDAGAPPTYSPDRRVDQNERV